VTSWVFPDTTVLCNFAAVRRLDLLQSVLLGNGRWTEAVAYEVERSSRIYHDLATIGRDGWLGEPIEIVDPADAAQVERIRRAVFGGTELQPLQHLGEAQTCHILQRWAAFAGSWWVSDDHEALRYARFQGLRTRDTADLVGIAVDSGDAGRNGGFALLKEMSGQGRHLRLPRTADELIR
jgi:hypothetical protein